MYAVRGDDSDVEVRDHASGSIVCVDCLIARLDAHYATWTEDEMAELLRDHKRAGRQGAVHSAEGHVNAHKTGF